MCHIVLNIAPMQKEEVHVVLFEPGTKLNTGNVKNEMTKGELEKI